MEQLEMLEQLELSLRDVGKQGRECMVVDGFEVFISPSDASQMNFAVPQLDNLDKKAIESMRHTFVKQNRSPRLEFFHELHPNLANLLQEAGFEQDIAAPVMALQSENLRPLNKAKVGSYRPVTSKLVLETYLRHQSIAFGGTGGDGALAWLPSMLEGIKEETVMVAAIEINNELVSGASIQIGGHIGELAGVWTIPKQQQQGFAFELCHQFLENYFSTFKLCWLSAAEGAFRLYEKLGFKRVGTQLNYSFRS